SLLYSLLIMILRPPISTLFPYTTLFRSLRLVYELYQVLRAGSHAFAARFTAVLDDPGDTAYHYDGVKRTCSHAVAMPKAPIYTRSEEHTSELQSRENLVCRLLLEKKKKK